MRNSWSTAARQDPNHQSTLHQFQMHLRHGWWLILLAGVGLTIYNVLRHNPYRIGGPGTMYLGIGLIIAGVVGGMTLLRMRRVQANDVSETYSASPSV
jgi:hypothetical protein